MKELEQKVEQWIADHREELIQDVGHLVRIKSVSRTQEGEHPYGKGCARVLDEFLAMGREYGFQTENHQYHCGSILHPAQAGKKTFGLWGHLDVVPEGEGWVYPPYECTEKDGFLIGRGVGDNKGPTVVDLYAMRCIRDLTEEGEEITFHSGIRLVGGCSEETGMDDVQYYVKNHPVPDLSLVTDCDFPVCHGEKGICELELVSPQISAQWKELSGGVASNVVPDRAEAFLEGQWNDMKLPQGVELHQEENGIRLTAKGFTAHAASPESGINAISLLCSAIAAGKTGDAPLFDFLAKACRCCHGEVLGISFEDSVSGRLSCVGSLLSLEDGRLHVGFNIRYPVTTDIHWLTEQAQKICRENGFECRIKSMDPPCYVEKESPFVQSLLKVYRDITGADAEPYVMGGGTYARKIPNAVGFGAGSKADFSGLGLPAGHGGCHGPDEVQSIDNLLRALKIYVLSLFALDQLD